MADPLADAVEAPDLRTRNSKRYRNPDGLSVSVIGNLLHYYKDGAWRDLDLTLRSRAGDVMRADGHDYAFEADSGGFSVYEQASGKGIRFLFPRPPDQVTSRSAYWTNAGIVWEFRPRRVGLKTTATVSARRGPRTYNFSAQMLGGLAPPTLDADGNLSHPAFTILRSHADGADGSRWNCSAWRLVGGTASFDFDDSALPDTALPYVIDPTTTFALSASANDGFVTKTGGTYPPNLTTDVDTSGQFLYTRKNTAYETAVILLRWDTSSIPDGDDIHEAVLELYSYGTSSSEGRLLIGEWYEPGSIGAGDYADLVGNDALSGIDLTGIPTGVVQFGLENIDPGINKVGYTGLRIGIDGGQPTTSSNVASFASIEAPDQEPRLLVTHKNPAEVSTLDSHVTEPIPRAY